MGWGFTTPSLFRCIGAMFASGFCPLCAPDFLDRTLDVFTLCMFMYAYFSWRGSFTSKLHLWSDQTSKFCWTVCEFAGSTPPGQKTNFVAIRVNQPMCFLMRVIRVQPAHPARFHSSVRTQFCVKYMFVKACSRNSFDLYTDKSEIARVNYTWNASAHGGYFPAKAVENGVCRLWLVFLSHFVKPLVAQPKSSAPSLRRVHDYKSARKHCEELPRYHKGRSTAQLSPRCSRGRREPPESRSPGRRWSVDGERLASRPALTAL